ncbi:hypothetical protein Goklo_016096, partial [Gossypium klotzschianum]|nr:hypothetical protein [Gossypium klotzschianum]
ITDVKTNEEVQELGRFAVEEYNRSHGLGRWRGFVSSSNGRRAELVFSRVLEAQKQVVSGIKYYLKIEAMENKLSKTFESVVVVKPWLHSKELLHFSPSADPKSTDLHGWSLFNFTQPAFGGDHPTCLATPEHRSLNLPCPTT